MNELLLDHIAIATRSIAETAPLYEALTGSTLSEPELVAEEGVIVAFIGSGPTRVELIEPTSPSSTVARFLDRRGPGLHHMAYRVDDIRASISELTARGFTFIDQIPRLGAHRRLIAFIHPESTGGILIELVQDQEPNEG